MANALAAILAACRDHFTVGKGSCGSSDPVFVADGLVISTFMGKITKAVLESLEGRKEAYRGLKEIKPFSLLVLLSRIPPPSLRTFSQPSKGGGIS